MKLKLEYLTRAEIVTWCMLLCGTIGISTVSLFVSIKAQQIVSRSPHTWERLKENSIDDDGSLVLGNGAEVVNGMLDYFESTLIAFRFLQYGLLACFAVVTLVALRMFILLIRFKTNPE